MKPSIAATRAIIKSAKHLKRRAGCNIYLLFSLCIIDEQFV
ncbi:hypothetical protein HMPREF9080_00104 [Cardiobacterium valvarum F0432]|uniref:Uncharacterized protein n=1 Tax=Cardiobacterium valvarum F0432 TaxID=797473 RepID=G9ZBI1_9GAMM|nr:hypothetical protein HMPREF9080_00104 [Cardiobacterium valvarum F0432]